MIRDAMKTPISFYGEGFKLPGRRRARFCSSPPTTTASCRRRNRSSRKEPAFGEVMQATLAWYGERPPARRRTASVRCKETLDGWPQVDYT